MSLDSLSPSIPSRHHSSLVFLMTSSVSMELTNLGWFVRWEVNGRTAALRNCSKQHASLCSSYLAFSLCLLLKSNWCNHTVVLTLVCLWRNPILFYQLSDFHMVVNLSIAVHALLIHLVTSFSVDEILLPRYMNRSTNFRVLSFNDKIGISWL